MNQSTSFRWISILLLSMLFVEALFNAIPVSQAQDNATPQASTSPTQTGNDDSDDLPIVVKLSGKIQELTVKSVRINDMVVLLPSGFVLPSGIKVGTIITINANLHNDDTLVIMTLTPGAETPTPTPTDEAVEEPTEEATIQPTLPATEVVTPVATLPVTTIVIPGCDKPKQQLAVLVSTTFDVPYADVVGLRCKGFAFGVIARAYLIAISGQDEGKTITVITVLNLRLKGRHWSIIIIELDVHPTPESLIIVVGPGAAVTLPDCRALKKWDKKLFDKYCKKPKKPKKPKK
jgi:hypothetical protein